MRGRLPLDCVHGGCVQAQGYCGRPVKYTGMMDVLTKTVANEGFRGLYKVWCPACVWIVFSLLHLLKT